MAPNDSGVITISGVLSSPLATGIFTNSAVITTTTTTVTDSDPLNNSAAIGLTVSNAAPVAANGSFSIAEDTPGSGTLSASDANGDVLTYTIDTAPISGTVLITAVNSGDYVYTPTLGYAGEMTFTFAVSDGDLSDTGLVTLTLITNNPPVADDGSNSTPEDTAVSGTLSATDTDHAVLTYTIAVQSLNDEAVITGANNGDYVFTPTLNFNGVTTFTFAVSDSQDSDTGVVTITVSAQDDPPTVNDDAATTAEDTSVTVSVLLNDSDPDDTLTLAAVGNASHGTTAISGTAQIVFTPAANTNGSDSFTYTVQAGSQQASATVAVTVTAVNDAPEFTAGGNVTVQENNSYSAAWATSVRPGPASASDESGQVITFSLTTDNPGLFASGPSLSANGILSFVPTADTAGSAVVTATLHDDGGTANGGSDAGGGIYVAAKPPSTAAPCKATAVAVTAAG